MRRPVKNRHKPGADIRYKSEDIEKFINHIMLDGKKEAARKAVYGAMEEIKTGGKDELAVFNDALNNAGPSVEVRSRRVGGANYQVPREVRPERRQFLAMKWIIDAARKGKGTPMSKRLAAELMQAANGEGAAVTQKENTHKMAEANKAFAHFAW